MYFSPTVFKNLSSILLSFCVLSLQLSAVDGAGGYTPGLDGANSAITAALNGVIRTFDSVRYDVHCNVNDGMDGIAENVTLTVETSRPNATWLDGALIPVRCESSSISANGINLILIAWGNQHA